jgi:galactokinase
MADTGLRAEQLGVRFRSWTGRSPAGVWRAPGRVNLIGEHLDYNGGHVLPFAIEQSAWVAIRPTDAPVVRCRSMQYAEPVEVGLDRLTHASGWSAYLAGVHWALRRIGIACRGVDVLVDSDLPQGGGLSSSAALECAFALALADQAGMETTDIEVRRRLALAAQRAEAAVVGAPVGNMDQSAALLAADGHALYLDTRTLDFELLPLQLERCGLGLIGVDTGHPHSHRDNDYADRRRACERAARRLGVDHLVDARREDLDERGLNDELTRRARHVITEELRTRATADALRLGEPEDIGPVIGPLMTASHRSMQHDFQNSTDTMDAVVQAALDAGAFGARMTGGGWGGTAIILTRVGHVSPVTEAVQDVLTRVLGHPAPVWTLRPAAAAARVG